MHMFDCSVSAPAEGLMPQPASETPPVPAERHGPIDLTVAIQTIANARQAYSQSNLPPTPPISYKRWKPENAPDAPHDPHAYFPMSLVK